MNLCYFHNYKNRFKEHPQQECSKELLSKSPTEILYQNQASAQDSSCLLAAYT